MNKAAFPDILGDVSSSYGREYVLYSMIFHLLR